MKKYLIVGVVCFISGALVTRYGLKANTATKIETVEVVKIKENVRVVKETRPDGTTIETKETTVEKDNTTVAKKEQKNHSPKWSVSVSKELLNDSQWNGNVSRAIFENIYVGITYRTNNTFGVGLTVTF